MAVQVAEAHLDCRKCTQPQIDERGCEQDSPIPGYWNFGDFETSRCPVQLITAASLEYIRAYSLFLKGYMPNAGGWIDQPKKFIGAMEIIENEVAKIQQEKERKQVTFH